jgi:hypothetical protein
MKGDWVMRMELRMKYSEAVYRRYHEASKEAKGKILDEFCKVCGYNRKYAIAKLNSLKDKPKSAGHQSRKRKKYYGHEVFLIIDAVWKAANYPWSVRLKEIICLWMPWIKKRYRMTSDTEKKLYSISASTIDRHLKSKKSKLKRRIYGRTKPGTLLRHKIPVRTEHWDVKCPGYEEADLVSHSGESGFGEFIYSLNFTDICSQWVETQGVMGKSKIAVLGAVKKINQRLPFKLLGIDSDNGSEFINYHLWDYCEKEHIQFTRTRPYKKDDNAHVEQKNWTHVRKFLGWDRYDSPQALRAINDLYENELRLFMNLFQPSVKLIKTVRIGSRKKRIYDKPKTPLDRLLSTSSLSHAKREELLALRSQLDPFLLAETINRKLELIWDLARYRYKPKDIKKSTKDLQDQLSSAEKETLEEIAQVFGMEVFVRNHPNGQLISIGHG